MTDKERLNALTCLVGRLYYAVEHGLTLFGVDEWCNICEVLGRDVPHDDVRLLDKYIDKYNAARGTDYDWDWMSLEADEPTRALVEDMLEFAHAAEEVEHNADT